MTRRLLGALSLLLAAVAPVRAADPEWIIGKWELRRDPDGGSQDLIEFGPDGHVAVAKRDGSRFTGRYHASDSGVQIDYKIGSQSIITTLVPSADRRTLYAPSAVTGRNAVYEKKP
ncbi:MAG TPA: hypothetical protein VF197_21465 [Methylomirabilota bacterium]|jgi:hypothetical protein